MLLKTDFNNWEFWNAFLFKLVWQFSSESVVGKVRCKKLVHAAILKALLRSKAEELRDDFLLNYHKEKKETLRKNYIILPKLLSSEGIVSVILLSSFLTEMPGLWLGLCQGGYVSELLTVKEKMRHIKNHRSLKTHRSYNQSIVFCKKLFTLCYATTNQFHLQSYSFVPTLRNNPHIPGHYRRNEIIPDNVPGIWVGFEYLKKTTACLACKYLEQLTKNITQ